ncbi:MAG: caspase family protein [Bacteroidetes bacterium]|nr:caspase family protein [Bacteroidota bacterium]
MSKGFSFHIGVDTIDRQSYGSAGYRPLCCCEHDADAMRELAVRNGFEVMDVLIDSRATFDTVESVFRSAAGKIDNDGTCMITYSGHGAQLLRGDTSQDGGYDEGLVLYDGIMKDDYINTLLRLFPDNSYIIFVCDACHSETMFEYMRGSPERPRTAAPATSRLAHGDAPRYRLLDTDIVDRHQHDLRMLYTERDRRFTEERRESLSAQIVALSACRDNELAQEGPEYGVFTGAMLAVLAGHAGTAGLSYQQLIHEVEAITRPAQQPCFTPLGPDPDSIFFQQFPFTLFTVST